MRVSCNGTLKRAIGATLFATWIAVFLPEESLGRGWAGDSCLQTLSKIEGHSMAPRLHDGASIRIISGGSFCAEPIRRNDVLVFRAAGHKLALIKAVRGLPGDRFAIREGEISVNDRVLTNSTGMAYRLSASRAAIIALYEREFSGVVPPDLFLVMGDNPAGSTDSSAFGLVPRSDVIGKVAE